MSIHIKYFGSIAQLVGKKEEELEIPATTTAGAVERSLRVRYQELKHAQYRIAVNQQLIEDQGVVVNDNDEMALLPPFAGG